MRFTRFRLPALLVLSLCALAAALVPTLGDSGAAPATRAVIDGENAPRYTPDGRLRRPEGWEEWIFVGAALGLSYSEPDDTPARRQGLHHVYLVPEAYEHYARTGTFPEGTMLVLEMYRSGEQVMPARQGVFAGERAAVEVALKDSEHFPEGWAYFDFSNGLAAASPLPPDRCYSCHAQHADDDNVFTQFYPVLRRLKGAG